MVTTWERAALIATLANRSIFHELIKYNRQQTVFPAARSVNKRLFSENLSVSKRSFRSAPSTNGYFWGTRPSTNGLFGGPLRQQTAIFGEAVRQQTVLPVVRSVSKRVARLRDVGQQTVVCVGVDCVK
jgi:hypothetical protein